MFKCDYNYTLNPDNTITMSPTKKTWLKAFLPSLTGIALFGAVFVIGSLGEKRAIKEYNESTTEPNDN